MLPNHVTERACDKPWHSGQARAIAAPPQTGLAASLRIRSNSQWHSRCRFLLVVMACHTLVLHGCTGTAPEAPARALPIALGSSPDLGYLRSDAGIVSRLVKIRNSSNGPVHIARWEASCECLTIEPPSMDVHPGKTTYIRLQFDPSREGDGFVGNLLISVEAFGAAVPVCRFEVPVSVIAPGDVRHIDEFELSK